MAEREVPSVAKDSPNLVGWLTWTALLIACPIIILVITHLNWRTHPGAGWHDPSYSRSPIELVHRLMFMQALISMICFAVTFRLTSRYLVRGIAWVGIGILYVLTLLIHAVAGMAIPGVWL